MAARFCFKSNSRGIEAQGHRDPVIQSGGPNELFHATWLTWLAALVGRVIRGIGDMNWYDLLGLKSSPGCNTRLPCSQRVGQQSNRQGAERSKDWWPAFPFLFAEVLRIPAAEVQFMMPLFSTARASKTPAGSPRRQPTSDTVTLKWAPRNAT